MTKIILTSGAEEYLTPGAAYQKVAAGEAVYPETYKTREMVAEKVKRKRRTKAEIEADEAAADATD